MGERNPRPLAELIDPGWAQVLVPVKGRVHKLGAVLTAEVKAGHGHLPAGADVLRAFTHPFNRVKVLIIGQGPYSTLGHVMGLSFSVHPGVALLRSLINILHEPSEGMDVPAPTSDDLTPWCEQGVCLLNRVLMVCPGALASRRDRGWGEVTQCTVGALMSRKRSDGSYVALVTVLWSKDVQSLTPRLGDTPTIASAHPSPLSTYRGFFGSKPFSRVNGLLEARGVSGVDQSLGTSH